MLQTDRNQKKKQDLKAETLVQRNCGRAGRANSKIEKATEPLEETNSLVLKNGKLCQNMKFRILVISYFLLFLITWV